jgi:heme-degrading monooxygenase HmoA
VGETKWASGQWQVREGREHEFVERWTEWLSWTSENIPGFRSGRLLRSDEDPLQYVSVSDWDDDASRTAWKASPGFREKFASVRELCEEFVGGDYEVAVAVHAPALRS